MKTVGFFTIAAAVLLSASCGRGGLGEDGMVTFDYSQMKEAGDTDRFCGKAGTCNPLQPAAHGQ